MGRINRHRQDELQLKNTFLHSAVRVGVVSLKCFLKVAACKVWKSRLGRCRHLQRIWLSHKSGDHILPPSLGEASCKSHHRAQLGAQAGLSEMTQRGPARITKRNEELINAGKRKRKMLNKSMQTTKQLTNAGRAQVLHTGKWGIYFIPCPTTPMSVSCNVVTTPWLLSVPYRPALPAICRIWTKSNHKIIDEPLDALGNNSPSPGHHKRRIQILH